ncbi:MAG: glycosyltransferase [Muribaculaceae bacterium]|nr:glycosyltransferase [Muribaculaceae bacterium]
MESEPLISVITVTYNASSVIDITLKSLQGQSFHNFEHIVVDGNSTDNTLNKVQEVELPQSVVISEPDKGLYDAMNKGLRIARGKYVIFLNAGDAFHDPDTLENYACGARKGYDIIYGDTVIVDGIGKYLGPRHLSAPVKLTKESFSEGMLICHQAFMVKKELAPLYNLDYKFSADYDWCVKCIGNANPDNCLNLNAVTIDYLSDGLTDKNKWKSLKERFKIMVSHYGLLLTSLNHLGFIFRAIRRGKI